LTIVDGGSGVGRALADLLDQDGVGVAVVLPAAEAGADADAGAGAGSLPPDCGGVVLLGGLAEVETVEQALEVQKDAFRWAHAVAATEVPRDGLFVTVQDTGGDLGLGGRQGDRAWLGGLAALTSTAGEEWPGASVKAIDCERAGRGAAEVAAAVAHEILQGGTASVVGLRADGTRSVPRVRPAPRDPLDATPARLGPGSVVVATGGARGVTAAALLALARACQPRLALLGRTPLADEPPGLAGAQDEPALIRLLAERHGAGTGPAELLTEARAVLAAREVRATLAALEGAGSSTRYIPVDVRDPDAVARALGDVRRQWGPISGFVHGAGTLADKLIADKAEDGFARVFDTKVRGLRGMLAALADDPLEVICLFSSVAGWFGNAGQSDYAMANATLDQVASAGQAGRPDCLVRSVAWGPWAGGMVGPLLAEVFTRRGITPIPVTQGAAAFVDEITDSGSRTRVILAAGDPGQFGKSPEPSPEPSSDPSSDRSSDPSSDQPTSRPLVFGQLAVHTRTHPWLTDHSPAGTAVLPLAMALDWLARGARAHLNDADAEADADADAEAEAEADAEADGAGAGAGAGAGGMVLHDLRMLRKILLPHLAGVGHRLLVSGEATGRDGADGLLLRLNSEDGVPHYQARLVRGESISDAFPRWPTPPDLVDYARLGEMDRDRIYNDDALFHGPRFQAITRLKGIGAQGAEGTVVGVRELAWGRDDWDFDVAALDGGMQLAGLWAWQAIGRALPVSVRECRIHRHGLLSRPARSVVASRGINGIHASCDVAVLDDDGGARIELIGVELLLRPDRMPSA
jgi:NAD(P)-dependent dehydrogenase (short-subunit alcohol dehydrogenase family)